MPNINTANIKLTAGDGVTKRTLGARLQDKWITVKDFDGVVGDGFNDDTAGIQAALDFAYGTQAAPHGSLSLPNTYFTYHTDPDGPHINRPVYFPPGDYKVTSMLRINVGYGVHLIGAGSHQTRIFWSGSEEAPPAEQLYDANWAHPGTGIGFTPSTGYDPQPDPTTALITLYMCWGMSVEGITFDASSTQDVAFRTYHWPPNVSADYPSGLGGGDNGSQGYFRDVHFTNALTGFLAQSAAMGSERNFWKCKFTNCTLYGHRAVGANALNHWFYGCHFANNGYGSNMQAAGHATYLACTFADNADFDIWVQYGGNLVSNCTSTSANFIMTDGNMIGNRHVSSTEGVFQQGIDVQRAVLTGNYSSNGIIGGIQHVYLKGNTFDNEDYLDTPMVSSYYVFEDGVMLKEPA